MVRGGVACKEENMFVLNSFSLSMIEYPSTIKVEELSLERARALVETGVQSAVGHQDTAVLFLLGVPVAFNRTSVKLDKGCSALVGQYSGPRLPEGATRLPEGATIRWLLVTVA